MILERHWLTLGGSAAVLSSQCLTLSSCSPTEPGTALLHTWSRGRAGQQEPEPNPPCTHLSFTMGQEHSCNQAGSLANTQECSTWHNAPMLLNPGVMASGDVQVSLCYPYKCGTERQTQALHIPL